MPPKPATRHEKQLENDLRAMRQLCGFQLRKIEQLKKKIASLERRLNAAQDAQKV